MVNLDEFGALVPLDHGLVTVAISREGRVPHVSVVNAGIVEHPVNGMPVVAFVTARGAHKIALLRREPLVAITIRAGWQWVTVEGTAELIGPDDLHRDVQAEQLRMLLRSIFTAAGGTHDDWDGYDRTMREEGRTAVLISADHLYSNPR